MGVLGDLRAALEALETMLSNCGTFQATNSAADAAAAAAFIFWPGQKPYTEVATKGKRKLRTWPTLWAKVELGEGSGLDLSVTEGGGCYVPNVPLRFFLCRNTPAAQASDPKAESKSFLQIVGLILQEMAALSHTEGYLYVSGLTVDRVFKNDETESEAYMAAQISVTRRGA